MAETKPSLPGLETTTSQEVVKPSISVSPEQYKELQTNYASLTTSLDSLQSNLADLGKTFEPKNRENTFVANLFGHNISLPKIKEKPKLPGLNKPQLPGFEDKSKTVGNLLFVPTLKELGLQEIDLESSDTDSPNTIYYQNKIADRVAKDLDYLKTATPDEISSFVKDKKKSILNIAPLNDTYEIDKDYFQAINDLDNVAKVASFNNAPYLYKDIDKSLKLDNQSLIKNAQQIGNDIQNINEDVSRATFKATADSGLNLHKYDQLYKDKLAYLGIQSEINAAYKGIEEDSSILQSKTDEISSLLVDLQNDPTNNALIEEIKLKSQEVIPIKDGIDKKKSFITKLSEASLELPEFDRDLNAQVQADKEDLELQKEWGASIGRPVGLAIRGLSNHVVSTLKGSALVGNELSKYLGRNPSESEIIKQNLLLDKAGQFEVPTRIKQGKAIKVNFKEGEKLPEIDVNWDVVAPVALQTTGEMLMMGAIGAPLARLGSAGELAGLYAGATAVFGGDILQQELEKGLPFNQALAITGMRIGIEAITEKLNPAEFIPFKGVLKPLSKTVSKADFVNFVSNNWKTFLPKLKAKGIDAWQFIKNASKSLVLEPVEEVLADLGNVGIDELVVNNLKPDYRKDNEFTLSNELETALTTALTMAPVSIYQGVKETQFEKQAPNYRYKAATNPKLFLTNLEDNLKKGYITEEFYEIGKKEVKILSNLYSNNKKQLDNFSQEEQIHHLDNLYKYNQTQQELLKDPTNEELIKNVEKLTKIVADFNLEANKLNDPQERFKKSENTYIQNLKDFSNTEELKQASIEDLNIAKSVIQNVINDPFSLKVKEQALKQIELINNEIAEKSKPVPETSEDKIEAEKQRISKLSLEELSKERESLFEREDAEQIAPLFEERENQLLNEANTIDLQGTKFVVGDRVSTDGNKSFWFVKGKDENNNLLLERTINGVKETTTISNQPSNKDSVVPYVETKTSKKAEEITPTIEEDTEDFGIATGIERTPETPVSDIEAKKADIERRNIKPSIDKKGIYNEKSIFRYFAKIFYGQRGGFNEFTKSELSKLSPETRAYLIRIYHQLKTLDDGYEIYDAEKILERDIKSGKSKYDITKSKTFNGKDAFYDAKTIVDTDEKRIQFARGFLSNDPSGRDNGITNGIASPTKVTSFEYPSQEVLRNLDEVFNGESAKYDAELAALEKNDNKQDLEKELKELEEEKRVIEKEIEELEKKDKTQGAYDFSASSNSGKWNSANDELHSLVQNHRKAFSIYRLLIGDAKSFKEIVDEINRLTDANIEYTDRMKRADETMSAEEIQSAIDSYNNSTENKKQDKAQVEKNILTENNLEDEKEYSATELVDKFGLTGVQKVIWDLIKDVVAKLDIKVKFSSNRITEGFEGSNNPLTGEILIKPSVIKNGRIGEVLVHEVVHALTTKIISRVNSGVTTGLTQKQINAVKGLQKLFESVKADNKLENKYPVKDVFEFIAHLTNDTFVKELESKDKSFLQKVVDFISDILGITNANELSKKYLQDIISDGVFLQKQGITVLPSDYGNNIQGSKQEKSKLDQLKERLNIINSRIFEIKKKLAALEQPKEIVTQVSPEKIEETKQEIVKESEAENKAQIVKWENSAKRQNYFGTSVNKNPQWENTLTVLKNKAKEEGKSFSELGYYITVIPESEFPKEAKTQRDKDFEALVKRGEAFLDKEKTKPYLQYHLDLARYAVITDKEGNFKTFDENGKLSTVGIPSYSYLPKVSKPGKEDFYKLNIDDLFDNQVNLRKLYKLARQEKKITFEIESISNGFPKIAKFKPTPLEATITGDKYPFVAIDNEIYPVKMSVIPSELADALLLLNQPALSEEQLNQLPETLREYPQRFRYIQEVFYNKLGGKISLNKDGSYTSNNEIISKEQAKELLTNSPINYTPSILDIPFDYITLKDGKFEVKNYPTGKEFIAANSTYTPTEKVENQYITFGERVKDVSAPTKEEKTPTEEIKPNLIPENPTTNDLKPKKRTIKPFDLGTKSTDDLLKRGKSLIQNTTEKQNQEALEWFNNSPISKFINFKDFRNLVNSDAWATWSQAGIALYKGASTTDLYHEAWHEFSQLYLTKKQKDALYDEIRNTNPEYKNLSNYEIEEKYEGGIAEDFRKYVLSGQSLILNKRPKRNSIFRIVYNFLREFITGNTDLQTYYERLYTGNINQYQRDINNAEFGKLNKSITGVIDGQERTLSEAETKDLTSAIDRAVATAFQERGIPFTALFTKKGVLSNTYNLLYKEFSNQADLAQEAYNQKLEEFGKNPTDSKLAEVNELSKTADNLYFLVSNWDEISKHHRSNSKYLQIAKEAVDDTQEDEDNIKQFDAYDSDNTTSSKEQASKRVLYAVASLPKFVGQEPIANPFIPIQFIKEGGQIEEFINQDVVDFDKTWNLLSKTLQNTYNYNQIYQKITDLSKKRPEFAYLKISLPDPNTQLTAEEMNIKHQFIQDLSKPLNKFYKVVLTTDEEGNLIAKTYKSGASATKVVNENFTANFQTSEPTAFIKPNANSVNELDVKALVDEFKPLIKSSKKQRLEFLKALGFNFSEQTINSEEFQNTLKPLNDKDPIARIFNSLSEYNTKKKPETTTITSPIKQLSYGIKQKGDVILSSVKEEIEQLLSLEVEYNDDYYSDSIQNAAGDPIWQIERWSLQTFLYNQLSDVDTYPDYDALKKSPLGFIFNTATNPDMDNIFMNSLFNLKTGERRKDKDGNFITIEIINQDGLEIQPKNQDRDGIKTTNLTPNDKFIQDFNSLLNTGIKEHLRYGDKNSAKGTLFTNFIDSTGRNAGYLPVPIESFNQESLPKEAKIQLRRVLVSELTRTKALLNQKLGENWKNFNKNGKSLGLFDGILKGQLSKDILNDIKTLSPEETVKKYSKQISEAVDSYFTKEAEKNKRLLDKIPVDINKKISKNLLDRNTESTLLKAYSFNNWILNVEHIRLFFGDSRFYDEKTGKVEENRDPFKRFSKNSSNGLIAINDDQTNEALNRLFPNLQYQKAGYTNTETTSVNTAIVNEDLRTSKFYDIYKNKWEELFGINKKNITKEEKAEIEEKAKKVVKPFIDMKIADGQGLGSLDFIRRLKLKQGSDHWTSEHEALYLKIVENKAIPEELAKAAMIFPVKIRVAGFTKDKNGMAVPVDYKFAIVPIIPSVVKDTPLEQIHQNMLRQGVGIMLFESGSKHSAIMNSPTSFNKFYEDEAKTIPYTGEYTINPINYDFIFDVLNVEPELKNYVSFSTQLRRMLFSNFFKDGIPRSEKLWNNFNRIIRGLVDIEKENILRKVGAKWNEITKQYDINEEKFGAFLEDELDKRNIPDDAKQILKRDFKGEFQYPLDASKIRQTIESIAISIVDNKLRKQKGFGEALIQQSSAGFEKNAWKFDSYKEEDVLKYGTNGFPFYSPDGRITKDGRKVTSAAKIGVSIATGDFKKLLKLTHTDGKVVGDLDRLNEVIKDENWLDIGDHREMITITGVRIPVQGHNSMEFMEVYHFLPETAGNVIIVSPELVAKSGGDFDVDKLTTLFSQFYIDENEQPTLFKELSDSQIDAKYEALVKSIFPETGDRITDKLFDTIFKDSIKGDLKDTFGDVKIPTKEKFRVLYKKAALQNSLNSTIREVLESPENFRQLMLPNNTDIFEPYADELRKAKLGKQANYKSDIPTASESYQQFKSNLLIKKSLGIAAIWNTFFSSLQSVGAYMNDTYIDSFGKQKPVIIRLAHNLTKDGLVSISRVYDKSGLHLISESISQLMNGFVDVTKKDWAFYMNSLPEIVSTQLYMLVTGVSPETMTAFTNQPIIDTYLESLQSNKSLIVKLSDPQKYRDAKVNALTTAFERYIPWDSNGEFQIFDDRGKSNIYKKSELSGITYIQGTPIRNVYLLKSKIANFEPGEDNIFTLDYLKPLSLMPKSERDNFKSDLAQVQILTHFLQLQDQSQALSGVNKALNADRAKPGFLHASNLRYNQKASLEVSNILPKSILDKLYEETTTSAFNSQINGIDKFNQQLYGGKQLFELTNNPVFNSFISNQWNNDKDLKFSDKFKNEEEWFKTIKNDFLSFIYQNYVSNPLTNKLIVDEVVDLMAKSKTLNGVNQSLGDQLLQLKKQFPELTKTNSLLNLLTIDNSKKLNITSIKLKKDNVDADLSNQLKQDWDRLLTFSDYSSEENLLIQNFAKNLLNFDAIQSGLSPSKFSLMNFHPQNDFATQITPILTEYTDFVDENEEVEEEFTKFYNKFKSNNAKFYTISDDKEEQTGEKVYFIGQGLSINQETYRFKDYRTNVTDKLSNKKQLNELKELSNKQDKVVVQEFTKDSPKEHPNWLYIGESDKNFSSVASSGVINTNKPTNVILLPLKNKASNKPDAFFKDSEFETNKVLIDNVIAKIKELSKKYKKLAFPETFLTENNKLMTDAPITSSYLVSQLRTELAYSDKNINFEGKPETLNIEQEVIEQPINKEIKEVGIQMQPDNIKKILAGTKTTTTRSESQAKQIGLNTGESGITTFGGRQFKITNRGLLSISEAGGKEAMEKSENFENNTPKYQQTKDWLQGKGKLYVYDIQEQPIVEETKEIPTQEVKPGVQELFNENPELANQVYEALGFNNVITSNDKIVWGHPAIGKTTMLESNPDAFIDWDNEFNRKRDSWIADKSNTVIGTPEFKKARNEYMINYNNHKDYIAFVTEEWNKAKEKANKENKTLIASPHMLLNLFPSDFDKVITMNDKTFMDRAIRRSGGDEVNSKLWKEGINETLKSVDKAKIVETDKYINDLFITPQQKQQAQQVYSQYLDTIFPDSKVKDIVYHGTNANFEEFKSETFYTTTALGYAKSVAATKAGLEGGKKVIKPLLINVNNIEFQEDAYSISKFPKGIDTILTNIEGGAKIIYAVEKPEQIHILGSKQDIEGFKEFTQGKQFQKLTANEKAKTIEQVTKEHRSIAALKDLAHKLAHRIGGKVEFENNPNADWKGYNQGMTSVLNEAYMTPDTPFHEILAHPIIRAIKNRKTYYKIGETAEFHGYGEPYRVTIEKIYDDTLEADVIDEKGNKQKVDLFELNKTQNTLLYQSLLKELETGRGKEVFEQVKRDYVTKEKPKSKNYNLIDSKNNSEIEIIQNFGNYWFKEYNETLNRGNQFNTNEELESLIKKEQNKHILNKYTLEEQQEEAIVTLLGMMAADKLDAKKDATLISKLKELWKQISDFVKSLLRQDGIKIDELPITTTLNDLAEIMAYGNNKIILPGYKVEYSTPLGNKYDTLEEVNNEIRGLADANVEVDLSGVKIDRELSKEELEKIKELQSQKKEKENYFSSKKYQQDKDFELYKLNKQLDELKNKKVEFYSQEPGLDLEDKNKYGFQDFDYVRVESTYGRGNNYHKAVLGENYEGYYIHGYNTSVGKPNKKILPISKEQAIKIWEKDESSKYEAGDRQDIFRLEDSIRSLKNDSKIKSEIKNIELQIEIVKKGEHSIKGFIEKNKEYEQSKEIIEQWKKENNIVYDPEEVYSRGQGFYSSIGAYSNLELDLLLKNLIQHIEDNKKAGGEFTISAFTKPIDKRLKHIEGTGDRVRFVIYPKSEHIKWAAPTDVYSGSVWDAHEKVSKDKKSELLGVSFTKAPALRNINEVSPNLADIIDNLSHVHNELGIELTTNNFRIEYDDNIDYSTKKLIDNINKILDDKYGKLVKPDIRKEVIESEEVYELQWKNGNLIGRYDSLEAAKKAQFGEYTDSEGNKILAEEVTQIVKGQPIEKIGKQPTQTRENTTSIKSVENIITKFENIEKYQKEYDEFSSKKENVLRFRPENYDSSFHNEYYTESLEQAKTKDWWVEDYYIIENVTEEFNNIRNKKAVELKENLDRYKKEYKELTGRNYKSEYTSQAETNLKVAALKEVARKYPRSLITSKVVPINPNMVDNSEIQYSKGGSKQDLERFKKFVEQPIVKKTKDNKLPNLPNC